MGSNTVNILNIVFAVVIPIFILLLSAMGFFFKKMYEKLEEVNDEITQLKIKVELLNRTI